MNIRSKKDLYAGLMFMAFGAIFVSVANGWIAGQGYPMGTAVRMGPAYFPTILGGLQFILGVIIALRGFVTEDEAPRETKWRIMGLVLLAVGLFGIIIGPLNWGAVAASAVCIFVAASAGHEFRWKEAVVLAALLSVFVVLVFYYGLGLPFKIWPWS